MRPQYRHCMMFKMDMSVQDRKTEILEQVPQKLNILLIEDNQYDEVLLLKELRNAGLVFDFKRVYTPDDLKAALSEQTWDIILSDYSMPRFNAPDALKILKETGLDIPVIIISGTVGEETAVTCLKAGANDFIVKGQYIRLMPAIRREIREAVERKRRREAEREINRQEKELKELNNELIQYNEELKNFLYRASHDLQEPLRKILVFSDRFKIRHRDQFSPEILQDLERIENSAQRMRSLIGGLSNYSRVINETRPFQRINLNDVLQEVLLDMELRIEETRADIKIDSLVEIEADPIQMRQMFQNLFLNSLKFYKKDLNPVITVQSEIVDDDLMIYFKDEGIGFDEKHIDKILKPFGRLHSVEEYPGIGIGLNVCRKIIERHRGGMEIHSQPEQGTTVVIRLPLKQRPPLEPSIFSQNAMTQS